ncbi:MAG: DUF362 domain-containing protein [Candidatus Obscuribacter sp.]|nr:DUF362 domain-containing protein [Candidatus Obscuribacter sp.]
MPCGQTSDDKSRAPGAAIELAKSCGASQITVAEGPGHMRDTEYLPMSQDWVLCQMQACLMSTSISTIQRQWTTATALTRSIPFICPRTIVKADYVLSVPKLKTHHWVGMTCSMKNLFGTVPGRKYGWPKNLLHIKGIPHSIIDLQHLVKPQLAIVDAIVAMEGDGPINGMAKHFGYVVVGQDVAAVDATCARMIGMDPNELAYIKMAGRVVGNIDAAQIDIFGPAIKDIVQTFDRPITMKDKSLLKQAAEQGS